MKWNKIAPWNWFKDEEGSVALAHRTAEGEAHPDIFRDSFGSLRTEMDRLFDDMLRARLPGLSKPTSLIGESSIPLRPSVDISEGKKAYTVRAELPGVELDDVALEVEGHTLAIRAEKRQEREEDDEGYHRRERSYGAVQRVLSLPEDADIDAINAHFKNGVLKLRIPKHAARASEGRTIQIERG